MSGYELTIEAVHPFEGGEGTVEFEFSFPGPAQSTVSFVVPYRGCESLDDGVRQAATHLARIAQQLAHRAGQLAE